MNLTFKGFLRGYCRELTGLDTDNLRKLFAASLDDAPAAAQAVMVFAAVQGKAQYLAGLAAGATLESEYTAFVQALEQAGDVPSLLQGDYAQTRYGKVWLAYLSKKESINADRRVIALMRDKTLASLERAGVSVYALCKQLGLNRGNFYAYLNGGDASKVSRQTARRIMDAANALAGT